MESNLVEKQHDHHPLNSRFYNFLFPVVLLGCLGGFTWAIRGSSGYGAWQGCTFAGLAWALSWYFLSTEGANSKTGHEKKRPYSSGWVIPAILVGTAISGMRGWMQWGGWFAGELVLSQDPKVVTPIDPIYGFIWFFIAGVLWAGIGAILLSWCGSAKRMHPRDWVVRIAFGFAGTAIALSLYSLFPNLFLPMSDTIDYFDNVANPSLIEVVNDNRSAIAFLGIYLGFLTYEIFRRDWNNVKLILLVGIINGILWSMLQTWNWAHEIWPGYGFNWWRCWESTAGIAIGVSYGIAFYFCNRPLSGRRILPQVPARVNFYVGEKIVTIASIVAGFTIALRAGIKGFLNIYVGNEDFWADVLSIIFIPLAVGIGLFIIVKIRKNALDDNSYCEKPLVPHYDILFIVIVTTQTILGLMVTGPWTNWNEFTFVIYYGLLFLIDIVVIINVLTVKKYEALLHVDNPKKNDCHGDRSQTGQ